MSKHDRISSLIFMGLTLVICGESIRLGPGSFSDPGPGLVPLGSGLILGIFSTIVFIRSFERSGEKEEDFWVLGGKWGKIAWILISLVVYAFLIDHLGFLLVTFFWTGFVGWKIAKMSWWKALVASLITTLSCYLLFERYLAIRFPRGFLGLGW